MPPISPRSVCAAACRLILADEGCELISYRDSGGVWTIGYGHTGPEVHSGLAWSQALADQTFQHDLGQFALYVTHYAGSLALDENQFGALVSLAYNAGLVALTRVLALLRQGHHAEAIAVWMTFVKDRKGAVVPGLVKRRGEEIALFHA